MFEGSLRLLVNLSWQFAWTFGLAWVAIRVFEIRSAAARRKLWGVVVLSPLIWVPLNLSPSVVAVLPDPQETVGADPFLDWEEDPSFVAPSVSEDWAVLPSAQKSSSESPARAPGWPPPVSALLLLCWGLGTGINLVLMTQEHFRPGSRRDPILWLGRFVGAFLFFHPLFGRALKELRHTAEETMEEAFTEEERIALSGADPFLRKPFRGREFPRFLAHPAPMAASRINSLSSAQGSTWIETTSYHQAHWESA